MCTWSDHRQAFALQTSATFRNLSFPTGPKSPDGKAKVAQNEWNGGRKPARREAMKELKQEFAGLRYFEQVNE